LLRSARRCNLDSLAAFKTERSFMPKTWQLQEAKNKFSEVVEKALSEGPQIITRRGVRAVALIALKDLERLRRPKTSLVEFLERSPLKGVKLELKRDKDRGRAVDLGLSD
jgi:prevent-host-death family protein